MFDLASKHKASLCVCLWPTAIKQIAQGGQINAMTYFSAVLISA